MVIALDFVKNGAQVCVKYTDKWHNGIVTSVDGILKDTKGFYYVDCCVKYESDGTTFDERFYNDDFDNPSSSDGWTFSHKSTVNIIKELIKNANDVKNLSCELNDFKEQWFQEKQIEDREQVSVTITKPSTPSVIFQTIFYLGFVFIVSSMMVYTYNVPTTINPSNVNYSNMFCQLFQNCSAASSNL